MDETLEQPMRAGGCQCGALRYEVTGATLELYVCHCRECRKQSASAFGISVIVPRSAFRLIAGTPRWWARATDSGGRLECAFCPDCGTRLWHQADATSATISIKGGSLDDPVDLGPAVHLWTARKLPGVPIPKAAARFRGEPD
ncbi:MAG: GFA family protein [Geminicoccaceae bacterium]